VRQLIDHHVRLDGFTTPFIWDADNSGIPDAWVLEQDAFDLMRVHVETTHDDDVLTAIDDV
jgi:hypothetical protein